MDENNNHQFQSPGESALQAPLTLAVGLRARLGLDESPRSFDTAPESLGKAISDPVWTMRIAAIESLAHLSDQQSLEWLLAALHDEDESVRACAARVLGTREDGADRDVIEHIEIALRDPAWHVRETAIYALGMMQSFASLPALKAALDDEDDRVRLAATRVIERLESSERNEQQENVLDGTTGIAQLPGASSGMWPRWMRRPGVSPVHHTHAENEKELPVIEETQDMAEQHTSATDREAETAGKHNSTRQARPRRRWLRVLEQVMAAILVLGIAISWFAITHLSHLSSGTPGVFKDTNARPLGAPTYTIQGNLSYLGQWSNDGHIFYYLQVDTQKQALEVHILDATTGHTTVYPVLDSSWLAALHAFTIDMVGHYLIALRPQGNHLATMEIWDITGQHAITTQTLPATIIGNGVVSPLVVPSDNEQKLAVFPPDGKITIWNIASGQKLATLEGKAPYVNGAPPSIKWYDHDQDLLFLSRSNTSGLFDPSGPLQAWNTITGARLFNLKDTSGRYFEASVSPDGNAIALSKGSRKPTGTSDTTGSPNTLEILDAHSGQVLHTYHLNGSNTVGVSFYWLSDSQRLLIVYMPVNSLQAKTHIHIMNVFNSQTTLDTFSTYTGFYWVTPDSRYLLLGSLDSNNSDTSRSMQIWQTSNGRLVATITTPGLHPNVYSNFGASNQYLLIGQKGSFDIWELATGNLLYKYHGFTPFSVAGAGGSNVFWSPDGKYLTMVAWKTSLMDTGSGDGIVTIWRMP